jgi:hypothetical protein
VKSASGAGSFKSCTTPASPADSTGVPSGGAVPFEQAAALTSPHNAANAHAILARLAIAIIRISKNSRTSEPRTQN